MGSANYSGERRKDSERKNNKAMGGFGPFQFEIGTLLKPKHTSIIVPEDCDAWRISGRNFYLHQHFLPEYESWEDAGFEGASYNPDRPAEADSYHAGWRDFPFKVDKVDIYTVGKVARVICRCIFKANGSEKEIERYL